MGKALPGSCSLTEQLGAVAKEIENGIKDPFPGDAHGFLMAIYKDPSNKVEVRLDAAWAAAPYEKPKLASTELKGDPEAPLQHKVIIEFVKAPERAD